MGIIDKLNKDFESRVRLGIMSILMVNDWIDFTEMKTLLNITDGNLASHSSALEKSEYIEIKKEFVGKKPKTSYRVTNRGRAAFNEHLNSLEKLMKSNK
ncbi:winged helix-turn-helix domain-containing protein [Flavobacterium maritimum]|jgi:DNA-binding MarR family transcriptional regulator|uniref:winged helix-turn-helix domain-containing protein n=1 Tax=Flavobacterium maritimum TaxID=3149042 RepID=UPI0032B45850